MAAEYFGYWDGLTLKQLRQLRKLKDKEIDRLNEVVRHAMLKLCDEHNEYFELAKYIKTRAKQEGEY